MLLGDNASLHRAHRAAQSSNYTGFCLEHKLEQNGGPAEANADAMQGAGLVPVQPLPRLSQSSLMADNVFTIIGYKIITAVDLL